MERRSDCKYKDSNMCSYVGSEGCETCFVNGMSDKKGEIDKAYEAWQVTRTYIPDDIDDVHTGTKCLLCRKEEPNDATCFAVADIAHPEPEYRRGMFFGFGKKVRSEIGSMLSVPVSCCDECKKRIRMRDWMQVGVWILSVVIGFVLMSIPGIAAPIAKVNELIPPAIVIIFAVGGYFVGKYAAVAVEKKAEEKTKVNVFEVPQMRRMEQFGWFALQKNGEYVRLSFHKKKPREHMMIKPADTNGVDNDAL